MDPSSLYLGFDLSTQQLKGIVVRSDLRVVHQANFDFDADSVGYGTTKGVLTNEEEHEVYAPVAAFLQALDGVLQRLKDDGLEFRKVKGISGAGMQHGSVYWSREAEEAMRRLDSNGPLESQLGGAFSYPYSPNWQDASTQAECDEFDGYLGDEGQLAIKTGSKAHHVRNPAGPQILRFRRKHIHEYNNTSRISLVSSFLASIFLGKIAPFDISDVCGMNLWDIKTGSWNEELLSLAAGSSDTNTLKRQLGDVPEDGGGSFGNIGSYFVKKYGFDPSCKVAPFTGDNPSTILALPLRPLDAIVSLGTSTTFLMSTPHYKPNPSVHFMNHPTTAGLYMFMLCYKNGGIAREQVRNSLSASPDQSSTSWETFDKIALESAPLGQKTQGSPMKIGLYFPRPEIVPNVKAGTWRFTFSQNTKALSASDSGWSLPSDDARAIVESQMLSLRLRSQDLVEPPEDKSLPAQPRRIYLVGGGSKNPTIAKIAGQVLGGVEGVYRLDVGENACALGAAYKAVWAVERRKGETFEELVGARWREEDFVKRIADGYQAGIFEQYAGAVEGLAAAEREILNQSLSA